MTLNVSLTPQLEELIRKKVESGMYNSASELVREALRLLEDRDELRAIKFEKLRKEVQKGIDSGPGVPMDEAFERVFAKIREVAKRKEEEDRRPS